MPLEREAILIENVRGALDLYQRSIIWAMTASAAFFLISQSQFDPVHPRVKILYSEVSPFAAYLTALVLFLLIGFFSRLALSQAQANLCQLNLPPEIQEAFLMYPSLATNPIWGFRVGTVLFCPLAVLVALVIDFYRQWANYIAEGLLFRSIAGWAVFFLVVFAVYGSIAQRVWQPFGKAA